jgi:hypothetical protein
MADRVSTELRRLVAEHADYLCEYCLIAEEDTFYGCEVDHIISAKHGGATEAYNLAYACAFCNRHKGSDIASLSTETGTLVRFFNPRVDRWAEHFQPDGFDINPATEIGKVTARILHFNDEERVLERRELSAVGRYPSAAAKKRVET